MYVADESSACPEGSTMNISEIELESDLAISRLLEAGIPESGQISISAFLGLIGGGGGGGRFFALEFCAIYWNHINP